MARKTESEIKRLERWKRQNAEVLSKVYKVKITVVKKINNKDMFGDNSPVHFNLTPECDRLEEGEEFIFDIDQKIPPGFCSWAFADIHRELIHLRLGGDTPAIKEKGTALVCCTDGIRPVVFKLERMGD